MCKLNKENGIVAFDLAILRSRTLKCSCSWTCIRLQIGLNLLESFVAVSCYFLSWYSFFQCILKWNRKLPIKFTGMRTNIKNNRVLHHNNALGSHNNFNERVFGQSRRSCGFSASLLSWLEFLWLFLLPKVKKSPQGTSLWDTFKHLKSCNWSAENYFSIWVPALLWGLEEPSPAPYDFPRKLFPRETVNTKF